MDGERTLDAVARVRAWSRARVRGASRSLLEATPLFDLEVASACNVVCVFCPRDDMARPKGLMTEETFGHVLDFLPDGAVAMISGLGDALLHPRLETMVDQLRQRGVSACVITNGVRLSPARQRGLIDAGIAEIQVSVHGLDEDTVRQVVPVGANPVAVRANLEHLATLGGPRVRINFVETETNRHARDEVRQWADDLGFRFFFRRQHARGGTVGESREDAASEGCGIFSSVTFVSADGDVMPCVNDVRGEGRAGNVRELRWLDVLAWKRRVLERSEWFAPCATCDDDYRWVLLDQGGLDES